MPYDYGDLRIYVRRKDMHDEVHQSTYVLVDTTADADEDEYRIVYESDAISDFQYRDEDSLAQARAAHALLSSFDEDELECPSGCIPTVVAVNRRPAIAMYLLAYERMERDEVAELLEVNPDTLSRYRRRVRRTS